MYLLFMQYILLVTALTTDTFLSSLAYGASRIKIPFASALTITAVSTATLCISVFAGGLLHPYLPKQLTAWLSFIILFSLGIVKLFDSTIKSFIKRCRRIRKNITFSCMHLNFILHVYADPPAADVDASCTLSVREALALSLALSIDGLAVGFGTALSHISVLPVMLLSLALGFAAVIAGSAVGNRLSRMLPLDLSWVSGALLILLAFIRL